MPFLIQPASDSAAAEGLSLVNTLIEPDRSERLILQNLQTWGWRVTKHEFGDDDFITALKQIEKDIKRRRRQTHAIAGELHGYQERPSLEDIWEHEAERMLGESAYRVYKQEIEKNWLRATDRTRQRNDYLDYVDFDCERPRLVTKGLDHNTRENPSEPPYMRYLSTPAREHQYASINPDIDPTYLFYLQDVESARKRQESIGIKHSSSMSDYLQQSRSILNIILCRRNSATTKRAQSTINIPRTSTFEVSSMHTDCPMHDDDEVHLSTQISDYGTTPPYLNPSITLIFPGTSSSPRGYIRHTRSGIKRSSTSSVVAPPLHRAGLGVDPYGWHKWAEQREMMEDAKAHWRFFLGRQRRSLNSMVRRRGEDGLGDMRVRELEREMQDIFGKMD